MRIALLSDIHGNLLALEAVTADIRGRGVDLVVNLGDSLSGPLRPRDTARFLMATGWPSIAGNHERQMLSDDPRDRIPSDAFALAERGTSELQWLQRLPKTLQLTEDVFLCHGTPGSDVEYFLDTPISGGTRPATPSEVEARLCGEPSAVVVCGHTHLPRAVRSRRGQLTINPGSVGLPAYDDVHPLPHIVETGNPDARYAILEGDGNVWSVSLLSVPYDHLTMARKARHEGREDWAVPLTTGYAERRT